MAQKEHKKNSLDEEQELYSYLGRVISFERRWWRSGHPQPDQLSSHNMAKAGFFRCSKMIDDHLGAMDTTMCPYCDLRVLFWGPENIPFEEHKDRRPLCPFVKQFPTGNDSSVVDEYKTIYPNGRDVCDCKCSSLWFRALRPRVFDEEPTS
jgi:hypothetical protein